MGHRPWGRDLLELESDRVGLEDADPNGERALLLLVTEDDDGHVRYGIQGEPPDLHLDPHRSDLPAARRDSTFTVASASGVVKLAAVFRVCEDGTCPASALAGQVDD
jgi:hypothetical protein